MPFCKSTHILCLQLIATYICPCVPGFFSEIAYGVWHVRPASALLCEDLNGRYSTEFRVLCTCHTEVELFLNQACAAKGCGHLVSWNCLGLRVGMCVCLSIYVSTLRVLITSGVIWCDIGCVQLVKKFHGFSLL